MNKKIHKYDQLPQMQEIPAVTVLSSNAEFTRHVHTKHMHAGQGIILTEVGKSLHFHGTFCSGSI